MTTSLVIQGKEYNLEDTFGRAQLNHLMFLKQRANLSVKTIVGGLERLDKESRVAELARVEGLEDAPTDLMVQLGFISEPENIDIFRGMIWLAKTHAGERGPTGAYLSVDEANEGIGLGDLGFVNDDADPTELEAPAAGIPSSSTTSSVMSPSTSSPSPMSGPATRS